MAEIFHLPAVSETDQPSETDRKGELYKWADLLLRDLGLEDQIKAANSPEELRKIVLDIDAVGVTLAIQEALHPENGRKGAHFVGLTKGALKGIIKARFAEAKRLRAQKLERGEGTAAGATSSSTAFDWTADLICDDEGAILPLLANLILFLRHHKKWEGVFAFNEFGNRVVIRKPPPWGSTVTDVPLTDHFESKVRCWFQREGIKAAQGDCGRAIQSVARDNPYHPVREYLNALVWDGKPRIDDWLKTYLHAESTPFTRAIGPRFLISAAARIFQPGCQVDYTMVLEGAQGQGKSELLRALAVKDEWFTDRLSHINSKDVSMELAGKFIVEIAELDALTKASASANKGFLTRRYEDIRPPYGRHMSYYGRQNVFAGTINPSGGYLKDPTGARRIWPVTCRGMVDRDGIERDRDQLWGETVVRYNAGAKWWLETRALEALATAEQDARFASDSWHEIVKTWIGDGKDTSVAEVLEGALGISPQDQSRSAQTRIAHILTRLGFAKHRPRKDGGRENRYWREK